MTRVAAVVLAAGQSSRYRAQGGGETKLAAEFEGRPIVRRAVEAALASRARPVVVVVGHARRAVESALGGLPAAIVFNPDYANGLSTSLRAGLAAVPDDVDGALILLGDMPKVEAQLIDAVIAAFEAQPNARAVAPLHGGRRGNPALLARSLFPAAMRLTGDEGARKLLTALTSDQMIEIDAGEWDAAFDVDTPSDLASRPPHP